MTPEELRERKWEGDDYWKNIYAALAILVDLWDAVKAKTDLESSGLSHPLCMACVKAHYAGFLPCNSNIEIASCKHWRGYDSDIKTTLRKLEEL